MAAQASLNAGIVSSVASRRNITSYRRSETSEPRDVGSDDLGCRDDPRFGDRPAGDDFEEGVEQEREALAPGVDHTGVLEHGQQLGSAPHCVCRRVGREVEQARQVAVAPGCIGRLERPRPPRGRR